MALGREMRTVLLYAFVAFSLASPVLAGEPASIALSAKGPEGALAGTLLKAGPASPLVLIVPGSGPTDRDGNNSLGVTASSYKLLAEALAGRGISSLRIDKRGMFGSAKAIPDANKVTVADYVADVRQWMDVGLQETGGRCIWLAGHSEGGLIALAAAQSKDRLCGIILIASPGRNFANILLEQLRGNPANAILLPDVEKAVGVLRSGETIDVSGMHPALQGLFAPAVQGFLIDLFRYDPARLASLIDLPMLIVQGGRDIQVTATDAGALSKGQPKARLLTIEAMTHTLKRADGDGPAASLATYTNPDLPVMPELIDTIAGFVKP